LCNAHSKNSQIDLNFPVNSQNKRTLKLSTCKIAEIPFGLQEGAIKAVSHSSENFKLIKEGFDLELNNTDGNEETKLKGTPLSDSLPYEKIRHIN